MAPRFVTVSKDEMLAVNGSSCTNKYLERDKLWLVGMFTSR